MGQTTAIRTIRRSSGSSLSTATPSSITSFPTALRLMKTRCRRKNELIYEYDDFRQTPRGVWYPTVSRWKNIIQSANKNKPAGIEFDDQVMYFYLDFTAELPDELFSPGGKAICWVASISLREHDKPDVERPRQDPAAGRSAAHLLGSCKPITVEVAEQGEPASGGRTHEKTSKVGRSNWNGSWTRNSKMGFQV